MNPPFIMTTPPLTHACSNAAVGRLLVSVLFLPLALALAGCGPKIHITWDSAKPGVQDGTPLLLDGVEVGRVVGVQNDGDRTVVEARLHRTRAKTVKSDSAFLVRTAGPNSAAHIEVVVVRADSPPIEDGAVIRGTDSEVATTARKLAANWKRTGIVIAAVLVGLLAVILVAKLAFKVWALFFCLAAGGAGAWFGSPYVLPHLTRWVPAEFRPDLLAYGVGFLLAYLLALLVMALLRAPITATRC